MNFVKKLNLDKQILIFSDKNEGLPIKILHETPSKMNMSTKIIKKPIEPNVFKGTLWRIEFSFKMTFYVALINLLGTCMKIVISLQSRK